MSLCPWEKILGWVSLSRSTQVNGSHSGLRPILHPSFEFCGNPLSSCCAILLTNQPAGGKDNLLTDVKKKKKKEKKMSDSYQPCHPRKLVAYTEGFPLLWWLCKALVSASSDASNWRDVVHVVPLHMWKKHICIWTHLITCAFICETVNHLSHVELKNVGIYGI